MSNRKNTRPRSDGRGAKRNLPPGVELLGTIDVRSNSILSLAFDPQGKMLASADKGAVKLWNVESRELKTVLDQRSSTISSVAFDPQSKILANISGNNVKLWDARSGKLLHSLEQHKDLVSSVVFDPQSGTLASGSWDRTIRIWDPNRGLLRRTIKTGQKDIMALVYSEQHRILASSSGPTDGSIKLFDPKNGNLLRTLEGHENAVSSIALHPKNNELASASWDGTVKLWELSSGKLLRTLEGHTDWVISVAFSADGRLLASKDVAQGVRLWDSESWDTVAVIPYSTTSKRKDTWSKSLTFHPTRPLLAIGNNNRIEFYELDDDALLSGGVKEAVHHTTGKIVLVGDHSVGKSALGYRMIHGEFKEQKSTHGQQFWVFPELGQRRADGTDCEAILWDFAGQPDYRLVHALFLNDADLALVLFDASDLRDPLHGVDFWLKQLQTGASDCSIILVAAQTDRGSSTLTPDELGAFCQRNGITGPITTSAATGKGVDDLVEQMKAMIPWEEKPATVTTTTFKRIKDYVLNMKEVEAESDGRTLVTPNELRGRLEATDIGWEFTDDEMMTAVGHLENYGYVSRLRTSKGERRILLEPARLNNLASSFVLEARRHHKGLGALEEKRLLAGDYNFPEQVGLREGECDVLLDAAALLFLEHNVCFRETDPLSMKSFLAFPELINLKKPQNDDAATEDGVAYTVSGPTENVFASMVVLLGYTHTFTRTNQWHNNARYEMGDGFVCGFRQEAERDGELDFVLCFHPRVGAPVRTLFQGLFESFLARRNLTVIRYEPVRCSDSECGRPLARSVVRQRMRDGKDFVFCNECGEKLALPKMAEPIQLTRKVQAEVELQRRTAERRTRFEQVIFQIQTFVSEQEIDAPECFISYAWGVSEHELWVEKRLGSDLRKAGISVVLDRWENKRIGASLSRFVERIEKSDRIIVVGTPLYRHKYENKDTDTGYVVAAEVDMIANRLIGTEDQKKSVLPLLLDGGKTDSLPPLLHGRVHADFRSEESYFMQTFDLILDLYGIHHQEPAMIDLRDSLRESDLN